MAFRISGLPLEQFRPLFGLSSAALAQRGIERIEVDATPGYPDRITLDDAAPGETVLLMNHVHQQAATPFHASHAIYVNESATQTWQGVDEIPPALSRRVLSLRGFDARHHLVAAELSPGEDAGAVIRQLFGDERVAYLHAHYAKPGCFAARVDRG